MESRYSPEDSFSRSGLSDRNQSTRNLSRNPTTMNASGSASVPFPKEVTGILNALRDGICVIDKDMSIRMINDALAGMLGKSRSQATGMKCYELWGHERCRSCDCPIDMVLQGENPVSIETEKTWGDNGGLHLKISLVPWQDENGKLAGFIESVRDITTTSAADAKEKLLAAIVESSSDAIISKTLDGKITSWNRGAEELYGYTEEEALGRSVSMLIPEDRKGEIQELIGRIKGNKNVTSFETLRIRKDGRVIDVALTVSPIKGRQGRVTGVSSIARDITDEKLGYARTRESEKRYRELCESSLDGYCRLDMEGRLVDFNSTFARMLGYEESELFGKDSREIIPAEWREVETQVLETQVFARGFSDMYEKELHQEGRFSSARGDADVSSQR